MNKVVVDRNQDNMRVFRWSRESKCKYCLELLKGQIVIFVLKQLLRLCRGKASGEQE